MSILSNIGSAALTVLKTVAPTLVDTAAGPFAPLIDPIIRKVFGLASDAPATAVTTAVTSATPDQLLALKQADNQHSEFMAQLGITDTASARSMEIATKSDTPGQLAWLVIGGFLLFAMGECTAMVIWPAKWAAIPAGAVGLMGTILGYLASEAKQAAAFYFGSSADSQAKTKTISEIAKS